MTIRGLLYVPGAEADGCPGPGRELPSVANRPLACLILEELAAAGVRPIAVASPAARLPALRAAIGSEATRRLDVCFVAAPDAGGLAAAMSAAAGFAGSDPVILHLATGMLGQSCAPIAAGAGEQPEDLRLLLYHGEAASQPLCPRTERLLGVSALGSGGQLSLAGVAVFAPGALARVALTRTPAQPSGHRELAQELVEIADALHGEGASVAAGIVNGWLPYSPDPAVVLELNRSILDRQERSVRGHEHTDGSRIEGRVVIHPSARVSASVILGPTLIGPDVRISDAYIGPYTAVGAGAVIENCEVLRSIVGPGARLSHVGGRIEGSTIGRDAIIFRDFRLPRAMRLHVGDGVEISLS